MVRAIWTGLVGLTLAALVALAAPSLAAAATFCVPNTNIAGCPTGATAEGTIGLAVAAAGASGDTIRIGAGTYTEYVDDTGKSLNFVGAGPTTTIIQGTGTPTMHVSPGSSVSNLGINLYAGTGNTGLSLAGTADHVAVTATQPSSTNNNIGVDLAGGTFTHGTVTLPVSGGDLANYGGVIGNGTITDSTITAAVGVTGDMSANMPTVHRVTIVANEGVLLYAPAFTIDDSVIRTEPGAGSEFAIGMPSALEGTITARHVDLLGSGAAGSVGVSANSDGALYAATTSVVLDSSIVRGYATSISASAVPGISNPATTTVNADYSYYDPNLASTGGGGTATIAASHSANLDPLFVNTAAGNFHLQAGSPAIDAGDPAPLAAGESPTDLDGRPRVIAGRKGDAAVGDVGAYEFVPHTPTAHASVTPRRVAAGRRATFTASGTVASPGDALTFRWRFDDGATAIGAKVTHAFRKAGRHRATVTVTDLDRFSATTSVTIIVTGPAISGMTLAPRSFRAAGSGPAIVSGRAHGRGTRITYRDAQTARATFTVQALRHGHYLKVGTFTHADRAGVNRFVFSGRVGGHSLAPGSYRFRVVPRNNSGVGRPVLVTFKVIR